MRMLCCDAGVIPIVLGGRGEPLDVGRDRRTIPTAIRSESAILLLDKPVRTVAELATATITAVEFPGGVRLSLKDQ